VIVKTQAVVLRDIKYRDQSKICLLLTREYGQITVILKGGRSMKSRTGMLFSPGNVIDTILYRKSTRDIQLASDASLILSPLSETPDLERFGVLFRVLDLVRYASAPEEKNVPLFSLLCLTIEQLCRASCNFEPILARFLLRLVSVLGFSPSLERCVFTNKELPDSINEMNLHELLFVHDSGGFALPGTAIVNGNSIQRVSIGNYTYLRGLAATGKAPCPEASPETVATTCALLQEYCARHLERMPHRGHIDIVSRLMST
jgi:DNA repair protein RecO (recombination protein O)